MDVVNKSNTNLGGWLRVFMLAMSAYLSVCGKEAKPTYVVRYKYDEGRLYSVRRSDTKVAELHHQPSNTGQ